MCNKHTGNLNSKYLSACARYFHVMPLLRTVFLTIYIELWPKIRKHDWSLQLCTQLEQYFSWIHNCDDQSCLLWRHDWSSQLNTQLKQVWILKPEKNSGLNWIRTHDLCHTGVVLYQLSYQANWELIMSWVRYIPVDDEECKWIYERCGCCFHFSIQSL